MRSRTSRALNMWRSAIRRAEKKLSKHPEVFGHGAIESGAGPLQTQRALWAFAGGYLDRGGRDPHLLG